MHYSGGATYGRRECGSSAGPSRMTRSARSAATITRPSPAGEGAARRTHVCGQGPLSHRGHRRVSATRTGSRPIRRRRARREVVRRLLAAGADMVGRTHCDELCYSLTGENVHYGAPAERQCAGPHSRRLLQRLGGGCGRQARRLRRGIGLWRLGADPRRAIAAFSACARPGAAALDGAVAFGPSFDVAGWFARDAGPARGGRSRAAADDREAPKPTKRLLIARARSPSSARRSTRRLPAVTRAGALIGTGSGEWRSAAGPGGLVRNLSHHSGRGGVGKRRRLGHRASPQLGPRVKERIEWAATVTPADACRGKRPAGRDHGPVSDALSAQATSSACRPRHAPRPRSARRSTKSRSSTATRPCACCAFGPGRPPAVEPADGQHRRPAARAVDHWPARQRRHAAVARHQALPSCPNDRCLRVNPMTRPCLRGIYAGGCGHYSQAVDQPM